MINPKEFDSKRKRFLMYLIQMDEAIVDYVGTLKKKSSEELLSGSTSAAKHYLDEIVMLESNTSDLQKLISNIVNFIEKNKNITPDIKSDQKTSDNSSNEISETVSKKTSDFDILFEAPVKNIEVAFEKPEAEVEKTEAEVARTEEQVEKTEVQVKKIVKRPKNTDSKIHILKSLIYLGGIANEDEINKYMMQYNGRNGDTSISIDELKVSLDSMIEKEMVSVDPLDENIEILQSGIDYLVKNEI